MLHGCRETISPPRNRTVSSVASPVAALTSHPTTCAPSCAKRTAAARPMPLPVPVMTHTFPSSRLLMLVPSAWRLQLTHVGTDTQVANEPGSPAQNRAGPDCVRRTIETGVHARALG